jgi:hypothetical protein
MQFGAKRCAQRARRRCTRHDGRAKPAWATRTGPAVSKGHEYPLVKNNGSKEVAANQKPINLNYFAIHIENLPHV